MRDRKLTINRRDFVIATGAGLVSTTVTGAAMAQESTPAPLVEHFDVTGVVHRFAVGDFDCLAVSDGSSHNTDPNDPFNFYNLAFGLSDPVDVRSALEVAGYDADRIVRQDTFLLVDTADQLVLIDTGIGAAFGGALVSNLEGEGIAAGDIDVVFTTHGHPDHIGGNVDGNGAPVFPNARYVMAEEEWNFWADAALVEQAYPDAAIREPVLGFVAAGMVPLADRYELIGYEEEIVPGIMSIASPGHTLGHTSLLVQSGDDTLWVIGDAITHPVELPNPELVGYGDADPEMAVATRRQLLQRITNEGGLAIGDHFDPFPGMGTVSADGDAWAWEPVRNGG